jgi:uncharacterized protein YecE (DUF72 family)
MAHIRIGISGWRYAGWRNSFYPPKLVQARELEFASREMQTIEINGSHYALQTPHSFAHWYETAPRGFVFSVKGPRYLTHMLRFRDPEASLKATANFFASGIFNLREKLGPILWQFPPNFKFDRDSFEAILQLLPKNTDEAAALARKHDRHVKEVCLVPDRKRRLRHAIEIRHASFCDDAFINLLRKYRAALVVSDSVAHWPYAEDVTADFVYMRLHGTHTLYGGKYGNAALDKWAARIRDWTSGHEPRDARRISSKTARKRASRDVFCYFDNDKKVQAPFDAGRLMKRLA